MVTTASLEPRALCEVYITALGAHLPGPAIGNAEMEDHLGKIHGKASRARERVLRQNGIKSRHYAIDNEQRSYTSNAKMAADAALDALGRGSLDPGAVEFLAAATTQGDLPVPGFASMVHGELGNPSCEIASLAGVCCSGLMALKSAYLQVRSAEAKNALACASEFPSRLFKASRYEGQELGGQQLPFETEFLRWMLSDGAGAALLQPQANPDRISLRIDWIQLTSFAHQFPVCMYAGTHKSRDHTLGQSWLDYPSFEAAAIEGAINLKQDVRMLDGLVKLGVDGFFRLIDDGRIDPDALDWVVCHYSSEFFKGRIFELLELGGLRIPKERWFSNLTTKGNVGSASAFVLLEELFNGEQLQPGQQILLMIPESGRSTMGYAHLTVVGPTQPPARATQPSERAAKSEPRTVPPIKVPALTTLPNPIVDGLVRQLTHLWLEFDASMRKVPILERLYGGRFTLADYHALLVNLRQQVIEGSRWIARAASSIEPQFAQLRSTFTTHAGEEHRDYQMLERDYVATGGELETILTAPKNLGSEALHAWMFHRSSQPNPFALLGAMFIIEGLGMAMAGTWSELIAEQLDLEPSQLSFLDYHSDNDGDHFARLELALNTVPMDEALAQEIVKTAKVTGRLYRLQLEELGNS